jgi:hypothetical protein
MAENNLTAADSLISQAEALGVQYNFFYMGDTPKKARRDLDRKRNTAAGSPTKPSQIFAPSGSNANKDVPTTDPFAGRSTDSAASTPDARQQVVPLPKVNAASPIHSLSADGPVPMQPPVTPSYRITMPGENDVRVPGTAAPANGGGPAAGNSPLRAARLALAYGDVRRAAELVQRAKGMQVNYQPLDDTPDKVEAAIRRYQEISTLDKDSEAYRRALARNLMEQADALLRWGEPNEAERLAGRAASMQVVYGPFEQKPQDLLQRIANLRQPSAGRPMAPPPAAEKAGALPAPGPSIAARQQAVELVRQARQALVAGQLDRAEWFARQAEQLRVPDSAFAPGEDRPGLVLFDLRQLRLRQSSAVSPAGGQLVVPTGGNGEFDRSAVRAVYDSNNDPTRNMTASNLQLQPPVEPDRSAGAGAGTNLARCHRSQGVGQGIVRAG